MTTSRATLPAPRRLAAFVLPVVAALALGGCRRDRGDEPLPPPAPPLPPLPPPAALIKPRAELSAVFGAVRYATDGPRARTASLPAPSGRAARITAQPAEVAPGRGGVDPVRGFVMARLVNDEAFVYAPLGLAAHDTVWVYADSVAQGWRATLVSLRGERPAYWQVPVRRQFHKEHIETKEPEPRFRYFRPVSLGAIPPLPRLAAATRQQVTLVDAAVFAWVTDCAGSVGSCCSSYIELAARAPFVFDDGTPAPPPQ